jgi:hypothetical protein
MDIRETHERTALFDLLGRTIHGTAGDDVLFAEAEWEHLIGFGGKDVLTSAFNNTWLDGGDDNDDLTSVVIAQSMGGNPVEAMAMQEGGDGEDRLNAELRARGVDVDSSATTSLDGGRTGDVITATSSVDSGGQGTFASAENDIWGGCGDDTINSVAYVDATLAVVMAVNRIYGGRGNDEIDVRAEIEQLSLTQTGLASNEVYGGAGHDWIKAVADTDFSGFDSSATNVLFGGRGNDTLDAAATVDSNDGELAANTL